MSEAFLTAVKSGDVSTVKVLVAKTATPLAL